MERGRFESESLGTRVEYRAWLPPLAAGEGVPWLVLLHGADASPDVLAREMGSALGDAAQRHRICIVAPDGGAHGWWLDSPERPEHRYATLVAVDLVAHVRASLPVSEDVGLAGISMGGHGALTLAFARREVFRSASSVSGVVDLTTASDRPALVQLLGPIERERARWEERSALHVVERGPERIRGLPLRLSCGIGDRWIDVNRALHARATAASITHDYDEAPAGHEWSYWRNVVPDHVAWHARALRGRRAFAEPPSRPAH